MSAGLEVADFSVEFRTRSGIVRALDRVAFSVARGETLALVGESGSGKSVTAYALLGLLDAAGRITGGSATLEGTDLTTASAAALEKIRGRRASMIRAPPSLRRRRGGSRSGRPIARHRRCAR